MVKITSTILAVSSILLASLASASIVNEGLKGNSFTYALQQKPVDYFDEVHIKYYFAGYRGALNGFFSGLFNNQSESVSQECLGETTYTHVKTFYKMFASGDIIKIFQSVGALYQVSFDIQRSCRMNQISFQLVGFCLGKDSNKSCAINNIITNFQANLFKYIGSANNIASIVVEMYSGWNKIDITNLAAASTTFTSLANQMGTLMRNLIGFTATYSTGGKTKKDPTSPTLF